jgi:predicted site-specific integrase-resolvase
MDAQSYLTTSTAARLAEISDDTLRAWTRAGRLRPAFVTASGVHVYGRTDLILCLVERALAPSGRRRRREREGGSSSMRAR